MSAPAATPAMLELTALAKAYGPLPVLRQLDLRLQAGERAILTGPSGCGKSTLLRLIAGLERPDSGTIRIAGRLVAAGPSPSTSAAAQLPPEARPVCLCLQGPSLWPHLTVRQQVAYACPGSSRRERLSQADHWLERFGVRDCAARKPAQISGGQARRVALARALATQQPLLLLDEPLIHLDDQLRRQLAATLDQILGATATTVLMVTHDHEEAQLLKGTLYTMHDGRIQAEKTDQKEVKDERTSGI